MQDISWLLFKVGAVQPYTLRQHATCPSDIAHVVQHGIAYVGAARVLGHPVLYIMHHLKMWLYLSSACSFPTRNQPSFQAVSLALVLWHLTSWLGSASLSKSFSSDGADQAGTRTNEAWPDRKDENVRLRHSSSLCTGITDMLCTFCYVRPWSPIYHAVAHIVWQYSLFLTSDRLRPRSFCNRLVGLSHIGPSYIAPSV